LGSRLVEYGSDLLVPLFFCTLRKEGVSVSCLRLARKGFEQILLGLGSFDSFHSEMVMVSALSDNIRAKKPPQNIVSRGHIP
jgi:hypothetical protein